jgi:antitoxin PrlF
VQATGWDSAPRHTYVPPLYLGDINSYSVNQWSYVTLMRNVMNDKSGKDESRKQPSALEPVRAWSTRVTSGGRVVLPAEVRSKLGLADGDSLRVRLEGRRIILLPQAEIVREIQEKWRRLTPGDRSLVDELITDRRAEAERD